MPRKAAGLTAAKVRTAAPGRYGDGAGLYLLVKPPSAKQVVAGARDGGRFWIVRYQHAGRGREMGLGPAVGPAPVSLAEARDKVRELHRQLRDGIDPLDQREADQAAARAAVARAKSFRAVATLYLDSHDVALRNAKHRMQWRNTLANYAYPHMGDTPIADVATGHIMAALEPIWRMKSETASRVRQRVEAVLDYATARGWRSGENPARWRGHISVLLPSPAKVKPVEHHAALPWQDIGAFMAKLRVEGSLAARAMELAILTASRTGEVLGARWPEVDLEAALWTVPASRMKAKREHRVPLCPAAVSLLRGQRRLPVPRPARRQAPLGHGPADAPAPDGEG
jgi:integrase